MTTIKDFAGNDIDFAAVVNLMDDELREELAATGEYDDDSQGFADAYTELHKSRFGEEFAPMCNGAW